MQITSNHYEVYCGKELIAYIAYDYDEYATQPWLVMVNGIEKFRDTTVARCLRYIHWHHKDGTLTETFPIPLEVPEVPRISQNSSDDQEAFVGDELVASINFDYDNGENLYWCVIINDQEIFCDLSRARCKSYCQTRAIATLSFHSSIINTMQSTITIPQGWDYPRLSFGNRTQQGRIIGMRYYPFDIGLTHRT